MYCGTLHCTVVQCSGSALVCVSVECSKVDCRVSAVNCTAVSTEQCSEEKCSALCSTAVKCTIEQLQIMIREIIIYISSATTDWVLHPEQFISDQQTRRRSRIRLQILPWHILKIRRQQMWTALHQLGKGNLQYLSTCWFCHWVIRICQI